MSDSTFDLDRWEAFACARVPEGLEVMNALRPQKNFRYPALPPFALGEELSPAEQRLEIGRVFRRFAYPAHPDSVHLHRTLADAVVDWLRRHQLAGAALGVLSPMPHEFLSAAAAAGCRVVPLPRDPEELFESLARAPALGAILISQPSRVDGFYFPDEAYAELIKKILRQSSALILSEESANLFTLNEVPPGTVPPQARCFGLRSLLPVLSPHGPAVAWWYGGPGIDAADAAAPSVPDAMPFEELRDAARALLAFQAKQGETFSEFQRKILVVDKGLRGFADALKPALLAGQCRVPLWPESGFHMLIEIASAAPTRAWCLRLAERHGLIVAPGEAFGAPSCVQICYAALPQWLERLGTRLAKALSEG